MEASEAKHRFQLPREVLIGGGVITDVGKVCSELDFGKVPLVLADEITINIAGNTVIASLEEEEFQPLKFIVTDSTLEQVKVVEKKIRDSNIKVVLGVGGGKVIDVAKVSAMNCNIPFISVPTAASHDGIVSPRASIKKPAISHSIPAKPPQAIIADTEIIAKAPYRLLASGCGDLISNSTAVLDWELAHKLRNEYYGEYAASLACMCSKLIIERANQIRLGMPGSVRIVMEALISSGVSMCIAGSSRPASGAEHMFSHALDRIHIKQGTMSPALHGEQAGVGSIMMMYLHGGDWKDIKNALQKIGAPTTAEELKIEGKNIIEALTTCHTIRPERYTILGEKGLTKEAAIRLASVTGVIKG
ncbi:MAG: NAD(P)-dependent glycerol-1-phosphate dehydrogenase [Promethearchaeota archaeon]